MLLNILTGFDFLPLMVVVIIAWVTPIALSLLRVQKIPAVVMEIIMGFIIGKAFIDMISGNTMFILDFLSFTGLIFIMFLSGLEIDTDIMIGSLPRKKIKISNILVNPLLAGLIHFALTLLISYIGSLLLSQLVHIPNIWFFSVILTTTFLGFVLPVLKNRGETGSLYGQMIIISAAVADVLGIILLVITSVVIRYGVNFELLIVIGIFLVFYIFYQIGKRYNRKLFNKITFQLSHAASQISIRGAMALLFFFVAISQFIGQEGILLGAFLSGLLISFFMHKERSLLIIKLDGMGYGFFIPIFFIMVGVKFDPSTLAEFNTSLIPFLIFLVLLMYLVKILPSFLWLNMFGFRKVLAGGFLMAARLGLVIAAAFIGIELGAITQGINSVLIIMAVLTCIFSPLLYNLINRQKFLTDDKVIIVGGSSVGVLVARRMQMLGKTSVIIEKSRERYNEILDKGIKVILGDGMDPEIYRNLGLLDQNYVVVHTRSDQTNIEICDMLRKDLLHEKVISIPNTSKTEHSMRVMGIEVLDHRRIVATTIENLILRPTTYHSLMESFENYSVEDIKLLHFEMDGKMIKELPLHKDGMIMLLTRGSEKYVPHGNTYLRSGDILTVFGTGTAIRQIREMVSSGKDFTSSNHSL